MFKKVMLANFEGLLHARRRSLSRALRSFGLSSEDADHTAAILGVLAGVYMAFCAIMNYDWYFESKWGPAGKFTAGKFGRRTARVINIAIGVGLIIAGCYYGFFMR